jgi:hypothetical protein
MRKTLLIAAATLAAGVIAAQADSPVYSQNIVGYVNTVLPGGSLTLISNPLLGPNGTNGATQVLSSLVGGETLFIWNNHGYYAYSFAGVGQGTSLGYASDWYDLNPGTGAAIPGTTYDAVNQVYWTQPPQLQQGVSAFIQNPGSTITNSFVGTVVLQNTNTPVILTGGALSFTASTLPIGGDLSNTNFNLPFIGGETVFVWNNHGYYAYSYAGAGQGTSLGYASDWYDLNPGTGAAIPGTTYDSVNQVYWTPPLTIGVGTGFLVQNPGSTLLWKQNLTIQ